MLAGGDRGLSHTLGPDQTQSPISNMQRMDAFSEAEEITSAGPEQMNVVFGAKRG